MTSIDNAPLQPEPPIQQPQPKSARTGASPWPRAVAFVGVLAAGVALGVGGAAAVAAGMDHMAWRQGARLTFVQHAVARALDSGRRQRGAGSQGPRHHRGEIRRDRAQSR